MLHHLLFIAIHWKKYCERRKKILHPVFWYVTTRWKKLLWPSKKNVTSCFLICCDPLTKILRFVEKILRHKFSLNDSVFSMLSVLHISSGGCSGGGSITCEMDGYRTSSKIRCQSLAYGASARTTRKLISIKFAMDQIFFSQKINWYQLYPLLRTSCEQLETTSACCLLASFPNNRPQITFREPHPPTSGVRISHLRQHGHRHPRR